MVSYAESVKHLITPDPYHSKDLITKNNNHYSRDHYSLQYYEYNNHPQNGTNSQKYSYNGFKKWVF